MDTPSTLEASPIVANLFIYIDSFNQTQRLLFEPSLRPFPITHFRKRLGPDVLNQVNEWIIIAAKSDDDGMARKVPVATAKAPDQTHPRILEPRAEATEIASRRNLLPADMAYPPALNQLYEAPTGLSGHREYHQPTNRGFSRRD